MKPEDQIKALAELDGLIYDNQSPYGLVWRRGATYQQLPGYLTSYDAIIPLIQKIGVDTDPEYKNPLGLTPTQLSEALLKATGKWVE